jgi:hypothetical protein
MICDYDCEQDYMIRKAIEKKYELNEKEKNDEL